MSCGVIVTSGRMVPRAAAAFHQLPIAPAEVVGDGQRRRGERLLDVVFDHQPLERGDAVILAAGGVGVGPGAVVRVNVDDGHGLGTPRGRAEWIGRQIGRRAVGHLAALDQPQRVARQHESAVRLGQVGVQHQIERR